MENIIQKAKDVNLKKEEIKQLLELYLLISKNEHHIFDLIYRFHDCDSWEDIFRDFNPEHFDDKAIGVEVAIEQIDELINEETQKN